ncbi:hypothetical protein HYW36_01935, partial [Candidatus Saccharibacteria bacterium]|nr:hypothetical protein [Candidatus Saccharibacteria bacterium]
AIGLDKPLNKFLDSLDKRGREREIKRVIKYMKQKHLIDYSSAERFEHGITITKKGRARLAHSHFKSLRIARPDNWDAKWRLVVFDIPEDRKLRRDALTAKLYRLDFRPLQRSVWIHPFPCHEEIQAVVLYYKLENYVTYIETSYIDKPDKLKALFHNLLKS